MTDDRDPLARATELARAEQPDTPDWEETAATVMRRIRSTLRPGRRIAVPLPDDRGSATFVNERVLVTTLRHALGTLDGVAPSDLRVTVDDDRCTRLDVEVVARYGPDLQLLGSRCRAVVEEVLAGLLLADAGAVDVHVSVTDVILEDPHE